MVSTLPVTVAAVVAVVAVAAVVAIDDGWMLEIKIAMINLAMINYLYENAKIFKYLIAHIMHLINIK